MAGLLDLSPEELAMMAGVNPSQSTMGLLSQFGGLAQQHQPMNAPMAPSFTTQPQNPGQQMQMPAWMQPDLPQQGFGLLGMAPQGFTANAPKPDAPAPDAQNAGPVPMPPVRPASITPTPPATGAPMDIRPPAQKAGEAAQAKPDGPGFMSRLGDAIGGIYGQGGPGDALIAMGAGMMSGREGLMKGLALVQQQQMTQRKLAAEKMKRAGQMQLAQDIVKKTGMSPDAALGIVQSGSASQFLQDVYRKNDQFKPVTDPAERAKLGIDPNDKQPYQIDQNGKLSAIGTPSTNVNVNSAASPITEGLGKQVIEGRQQAVTAVNTLRTIQEQRKAMEADGGIYSGAGADTKLQVAKIGAALGITDPSIIANTEKFRAMASAHVLDSIKSLGTNPSNADREFIEKVKGGQISLDLNTMRELMNIQERAARDVIAKHNELAGKVVGAIPNLGPLTGALHVPVPPELAQQTPAPSAPAAPQQQSQQPRKLPTWRMVQ